MASLAVQLVWMVSRKVTKEKVPRGKLGGRSGMLASETEGDDDGSSVMESVVESVVESVTEVVEEDAGELDHVSFLVIFQRMGRSLRTLTSSWASTPGLSLQPILL